MASKLKELPFKEGETYRLLIGPLVYKIHIVKIIDEGLTFSPQVVYRYYGKSKQYWHYEVKSAFMLTGEIDITESNFKTATP